MNGLVKFIKTLWRRYLVDGIVVTLPGIIGLFGQMVTLPIVLRYLPMADYGLWQFVFALQVWVAAFSAAQVSQGVLRGVANNLDGTFWYGFKYRFRVVGVAGLLVLAIAGVLGGLGIVTGKLLILLIIMGIFILAGYLPQVSFQIFFTAKKHFWISSWWQLALTVLVPSLAMLAAVLTQDVLVYAGVHFGTTALISWLGFWYVMAKYKIIESYQRGEIDRESSSYGIRMVPTDLIQETSNALANFIIGPFFGFAALAVFSVATKLDGVFRNLTGTSGRVLYAEFAREGMGYTTRVVKRYFGYGLVLAIGAAIAAWAVGVWYIDWWLPVEYDLAKYYFAVLVVGLPAMIVTVILKIMLSANLRYKEMSFASIISNLARIAMILGLGFVWGMTGVAWALTAGSWLALGLFLLALTKKDLIAKAIRILPGGKAVTRL